MLDCARMALNWFASVQQLDCASCGGKLAIDDDFQPESGFIRLFESDPILETNSACDRDRQVAR